MECLIIRCVRSRRKTISWNQHWVIYNNKQPPGLKSTQLPSWEEKITKRPVCLAEPFLSLSDSLLQVSKQDMSGLPACKWTWGISKPRDHLMHCIIRTWELTDLCGLVGMLISGNANPLINIHRVHVLVSWKTSSVLYLWTTVSFA